MALVPGCRTTVYEQIIVFALDCTRTLFCERVRLELSQVVVTRDRYKAKREQSLNQEHRISSEDEFRRFRMSDISKPDPIAKVAGLVALPIVAIWAGLTALVGFAMFLVLSVLKALGKLAGRRR
jgi:hypothetical protein